MNTPRKFWLVLIGAVLTLVVIACSCNSIVTTQTLSTPTLPPPPTAVPPTEVPPPTTPTDSMAGLAGSWLDPDTGTVTTIVAQGDGYAVESVINPNRGGNELTSTQWGDGILSWTYCVPGGACVTAETISVSGDSLYTNWSNDQGYSGSTTMQRVTSAPVGPATSGQEPSPSMAGKWQDPDAIGTDTTIAWQNGQYVVVSIINSSRGVNELTWSKYKNGVLSWEYCPEGLHCITSSSISVTSDSLTANWYWTDGGNSGTTVYQRVP